MPTNLWPTPGVGDGAAEAIPAPTFLIIGAMKTGTTSLYHYLAHHPQVHMPRQKEIDFFSEPAIWRLGWEWYLGQFASAPSSAVAIGEASTSYTKFPEFSDVPRRIAERLPRVRLVYLIRHPVERIHSQYAHHVLMGDERRPISEALLADPRYLNTSQYAMQLEQYLRYFDRDQILIVQAEHLRSVRRTTVRRIFTFLGIDPEWTSPVIDQEFYQTAERWWVPPTVRRARRLRSFRRLVHSSWPWLARLRRRTLERVAATGSAIPAAITGDVQRWLEDRLRDDVRRLRQYMGEDFDGWGLA